MQAITGARPLQFPRLAGLIGLVIVAPFAIAAAGWVVHGPVERWLFAGLAAYSALFARLTSRVHGWPTATLISAAGFAVVMAYAVGQSAA